MLINIIRFLPNICVSLLCILAAFALFDALWLGVVAKDWYAAEMSSLMRKELITWPWLVFYLLYSGVVFVLAVVANREKSALYAAIDGGLLGLASYGAYNLTNYSIIEGFSLKIMLIDWTWGTVLTAICAMIGWFGFQFRRS